MTVPHSDAGRPFFPVAPANQLSPPAMPAGILLSLSVFHDLGAVLRPLLPSPAERLVQMNGGLAVG